MPKVAASSYVGRLGHRRQVVLPKPMCDAIGLAEGDFVEVSARGGIVIVKPKRSTDADAAMTAEEARKVRRGLKQLREGKTRPWSTVKHELGL